MHYVDLQRVNGLCESVHVGSTYADADIAYRAAIDNAGKDVANVSWYFNMTCGHQEHIGTRIFRAITD